MAKKYKLLVEFEAEPDENGLTDYDVMPNDDIDFLLKNGQFTLGDTQINSVDLHEVVLPLYEPNKKGDMKLKNKEEVNQDWRK